MRRELGAAADMLHQDDSSSRRTGRPIGRNPAAHLHCCDSREASIRVAPETDARYRSKHTFRSHDEELKDKLIPMKPPFSFALRYKEPKDNPLCMSSHALCEPNRKCSMSCTEAFKRLIYPPLKLRPGLGQLLGNRIAIFSAVVAKEIV